MPKQQKQPFKCPLGDPKVFCESFKALHDAVVQIRGESLQKDMSIIEVETHLVFIRDRIDELLAKVRLIPTKR